jgi:hypothetical protein
MPKPWFDVPEFTNAVTCWGCGKDIVTGTGSGDPDWDGRVVCVDCAQDWEPPMIIVRSVVVDTEEKRCPTCYRKLPEKPRYRLIDGEYVKVKCECED